MTSEPGHIQINQGEALCSALPVTISTVLGSCVAVCLFDPVSGCGGMNHFVLPRATGGPRDGLRCGDVAVVRLVEAMLEAGAALADLRAKIFGGAVPLWVAHDSPFAVGTANVKAARCGLERFGIPVTAARTGGADGIRIHFDSWNGDVRVRRVAGPLPPGASPRTAPAAGVSPPAFARKAGDGRKTILGENL